MLCMQLSYYTPTTRIRTRSLPFQTVYVHHNIIIVSIRNFIELHVSAGIRLILIHYNNIIVFESIILYIHVKLQF